MFVDVQVKAFVGIRKWMLSIESSSCMYSYLHCVTGECSDELIHICRHSNDGSPPVWTHNGTVESGQLLATAFPSAEYTVLTRTEHTAINTGVDGV